MTMTLMTTMMTRTTMIKNLAEVDDGSKKADDNDDDDNADEGGREDKKAEWKHRNAEDD